MKTRKTSSEKKPQNPDFLFPCGDFQKMAELMKDCCQDQSAVTSCCSMMRRMMDYGKRSGAKKTKETQEPAKGGGNG